MHLVGYDGSGPSIRALRWAARHARPGGRVVVVHAPGLAGDPELAGCDLLCEPEPGEGVSGALLRVARRQRADTIVVAAHDDAPVVSLLGPVAQRLIRESPIPVTIVGPHAHA